MCDEPQKTRPSFWDLMTESPMSIVWLIAGTVSSGFAYFNVICNSMGKEQIAAVVFVCFSIATFFGFLYERATKSEEERKEAEAMFPMYSFVFSIMASIAPNIIPTGKFPGIDVIRVPLGLFIVTLLWQAVLFYKLDVRENITSKQNLHLTVAVNHQEYDVEVKTKKKE